jgi:hypothetical protein
MFALRYANCARSTFDRLPDVGHRRLEVQLFDALLAALHVERLFDRLPLERNRRRLIDRDRGERPIERLRL